MSTASLGGYVVDYLERRPVDRVSRSTGASQLAPSVADEIERLFKKSVDELLQLRRIGDDWDGDGAVGPIPELVDSAIEVIVQKRYPMPPSRIVPVNNGQITLEWYCDGYFMSLRVEAPGYGRQMFVKPDGTTLFSEVNWSSDRG